MDFRIDPVHESRKKWKELAFKWLAEKRNYHNFDLDSCLTVMEIDPLSKEAATAAFWISYVPDELPLALMDVQEQRINLLLNTAINEAKESDRNSHSYLKFLLCGILAINHIKPGQPFAEFPSAVKALEAADAACVSYQSDVTTDMVDDPSSWGDKYLDTDLSIFSMELVSAITSAELPRVFYEKGDYEKAFQKLNGATWSLCATRIKSESDDIGDFIPYLPHTLESFSVQEAANLFEELKRHSKDVKDWDSISVYCDVMKYLGYNGLYDWLSDITDSNGDTFGTVEYWGKAITYAQVQMSLMTSPVPLITYDDREKMDTLVRLKRDFFPSTWQSMSKQSQELLVDAEVEWIHNRLDNMTKDLRPMLESELLADFPFIQHVTTMNDPRLTLTRIRDELRNNPTVRSTIDSLNLDHSDKQWLKDHLWRILHDVIDTRNFFEKEQAKHERKSDKYRKMAAKAATLHHLLLGIGCEGALQRILKIKGNIQSI